MRTPNFFIVGAPKCGTTALSAYLQANPSIYFSDPKEPHYFADDFDGHRQIREWKEYLSLFRKAGPEHRAVGEGSVWYLYSSRALHNIRACNPRARVIVMLRNPLDLVQSLHQQQFYSLYEDQPDLEVAWSLQSQRLQGRAIPRLCRQPELLQYGAIARLGNQLQRLLNIFPPEQIKVILYDDLVADTLAVYRQVLEFLDVPYDGQTEFKILNPSKKYRHRWLRALAAQMPMSLRNTITRLRFSSHVRWLPALMDRLMATPGQKIGMSPRLRAELQGYFQSDVALLERLLGRDLGHWLRDGR